MSQTDPLPRQAGCICPPAKPPFDAMLDSSCPVHGEQARTLVIDAIDSGRVIQAQPPGRCELCGVVEETRPYGPNGESVCFGCGPRSPDPSRRRAAERQFEKRMGWAA